MELEVEPQTERPWTYVQFHWSFWYKFVVFGQYFDVTSYVVYYWGITEAQL